MKLKSFILLLLISAFYLPLAGQALTMAQVPSVIRDSGHYKFPDVNNFSWNKSGTNYKAKFTRNGRPVEATFNSSGQWQRTEVGWLLDSLRPAVRTALASGNPGYKIQSVTRVIQKGKAPYNMVLMEQSGIHRKVEIDDNGKTL